MAWRTIAHQDLELTVGSRSSKLLLWLTVLSVILAAYIYPIRGSAPITTARFGGFVTGWLTTLLPLVGVLLGYGAVVSERESGAIRLSLSLPHSRRDLLVGTVVSRGAGYNRIFRLLAVTLVGLVCLLALAHRRGLLPAGGR